MEFGVRILIYIDEFMIEASVGRMSTDEDFDRVRKVVGNLLGALGLYRYERKGVWGTGYTRMNNLGMKWDTEMM